MLTARNGDTTLVWEDLGPSDAPAILLVMGLGAQLIAWRDGFCQHLIDQGFRVIRFDNRDVGLSSYTDATPPSFVDMGRAIAGRPKAVSGAYTLGDMAEDAVAVLDAAGVRRAHVVGASLGGMVSQTIAINHPERVLSLTSIMSKPGSLFAGLPGPVVLKSVMAETPVDRAGAIQYELERSKRICGPLFEPELMREFLEMAYDRSSDRTGMAFQLLAIFMSGDRTKALRQLNVPTLVMHGRSDPLVGLSGGIATAKAIPGAQLIIHNNMGHDLPRPLWPSLTDSIGAHCRRAGGVERPLTEGSSSRTLREV